MWEYRFVSISRSDEPVGFHDFGDDRGVVWTSGIGRRTILPTTLSSWIVPRSVACDSRYLAGAVFGVALGLGFVTQGAVIWQGTGPRTSDAGPYPPVAEFLWEASDSLLRLVGPQQLVDALPEIAASCKPPTR